MLQIRVQEIITGTVQGEGFWTGTISDFVRLWGCPVGCNWCDTGYANSGASVPFVFMGISEILRKTTGRNIVITGGEPFSCPELPLLVSSFVEAQKTVRIETSGVIYRPTDAHWVTLSPKTHVTGRLVDPAFWVEADEIKIVVQSMRDFEFYLDSLLEHNWNNSNTFVQPCWKDGMTIDVCMNIMRKYPWARLSVQMHKLLGLP